MSYIVGLARNARLEATVRYAEAMLADEYERTGTKQRLIDEFVYAADSWDTSRRVITRLEHGSRVQHAELELETTGNNFVLKLRKCASR